MTFEQADLEIYEAGFLIFQDFRYDPSDILRFYGRVVLFQSDSYDSRVYEFENDVNGVMFNPALYGEGIRWYLIVELSPTEFFHISGKYSETIKPTESSLGSGLNTIRGSLDNRISFQIDIKF